ncbi:hypothetical protein B0H17DRAFT_1209395 [Mycena rosella]|uniref:Uncharacterized protein n=1 Tax=Mycena rosella TaxID=1033263 RepID=A0AAD7CYT6_MYCRO|nr:hypothetical protein B0H17DRAFT_1209395 [Mycena rosella]
MRMLELTVKDGWSVPPPSLSSVELSNVLALTKDAVLVETAVVTDGLLVPQLSDWIRDVLRNEDYATDGLCRIDLRIVFTINLFTNFVVMGLTAGRIWWVTSAKRAVFGPEFVPRYTAAIAILLESGTIYC